jgi:hypothetical protein
MPRRELHSNLELHELLLQTARVVRDASEKHPDAPPFHEIYEHPPAAPVHNDLGSRKG